MKMICSVEGCEGKHLAKSYCRKHYEMFKKHGDPLKVLINYNHTGKCSVEGCNGEYEAKGYCKKHWKRLKNHGDPLKSLVNRENDGKCSMEKCEEKYYSKNFCRKHYERYIKYGDPLKQVKNTEHNGKCKINGCVNKYSSNGYCKLHYARVLQHGDPLKFLVNRSGKCSIKECEEKNFSNSFCKHHFYTSDIPRIKTSIRRSLKKNAMINDFTIRDWRRSLKHFKNECAYCGDTDKKIHAEHVVPLCKGGSHTITNIIPACVSCNCRKNDSLIEVWYPKQPFYSSQREMEIYKWIGYKVHSDVLQATLF